MTVVHGTHAWRALERWHQPFDRPTYRQAVVVLAPGLLAHGIAIAVHSDAAAMLWQPVDPDDQAQLESLWHGLHLQESPEPLIACGEHRLLLVFQPAGGSCLGASQATAG